MHARSHCNRTAKIYNPAKMHRHCLTFSHILSIFKLPFLDHCLATGGLRIIDYRFRSRWYLANSIVLHRKQRVSYRLLLCGREEKRLSCERQVLDDGIHC